MKFDDLLQHVGEFGKYQRQVYLLVCIPVLFASFHKIGWVFLGAVPSHRCQLDGEEGFNFSIQESSLNESIPWDSTNQRWSRCEMYVDQEAINGSEDGEKGRQKCSQWVYSKDDHQSTVVTEFDLVCDRNWLRAMVQSMYFVGEFLGSTILGFLADRIGRKKVIVIGLLGQGICGISAGCFKNYYSFVVLRSLLGMFTQGVMIASFILAVEFVGPTKRPMAGVLTNYFFTAGYFVIAGFAYWLREWPQLMIALSAFSLVYLPVVWWVPESARWLITVKKTDQAMEIIQKAARVNGHQLPPNFALKIESEKSDKPQIRAIDLMWNPSVRVKVLIMCYTWLVNSAVYYGLSLNTANLGGNTYLNFFMSALVEIPAYAICLVSLLWLGRRLPLCVSMCTGGLALLCTSFIPMEYTSIILTLAMIGKIGISISYAIIFIFAAEVYPTQVRNVAIGINSTFARLGSMITSFIVMLADYWKPLPLITLGAMSLTAGLMTLVLPETHCKALPDNFAEASKLMTTTEDSLILRRESRVYVTESANLELKQLNKNILSQPL